MPSSGNRTLSAFETSSVCELTSTAVTTRPRLRPAPGCGRSARVRQERPHPGAGRSRGRVVTAVLVSSHTLEVSNADKVLFPEDGITKGDVVEYYRRIAPQMLPHLEDRPLALHRFPDGIDREGFFQKTAPDYFPDWIETVELPRERGGTVRHVVCNDAATLVYLADQGVLVL